MQEKIHRLVSVEFYGKVRKRVVIIFIFENGC